MPFSLAESAMIFSPYHRTAGARISSRGWCTSIESLVKYRPSVPPFLTDTMGILDIFKSDGLRSPASVRHNGKHLSEILAQHAKFVRGDETGARAELSGADLSRVNFYKVNLTYANLQGANLEGASLREAKLASADLSKAKLASRRSAQSGSHRSQSERRRFDGSSGRRRRALPRGSPLSDSPQRRFRSGEFPSGRNCRRGFPRRRNEDHHPSGNESRRRGPFGRGSFDGIASARIQESRRREMLAPLDAGADSSSIRG